jgi:hypothetical protein
VFIETGGSPKQTFVEFYGYAHQNVTRVVLKLADGRQYGAKTFAAWPGSGLRLWAFPVPASVASAALRQSVWVGYNTAGQVIWQMHHVPPHPQPPPALQPSVRDYPGG